MSKEKEIEPKNRFVYLHEEISIIDADSIDERELKIIKLQPGTYSLNQIPNPFGTVHGAKPWLVIQGTKLGMALAGWKDQEAVDFLPNDVTPPGFEPELPG